MSEVGRSRSPWGMLAWGGLVGPVVFVFDWALLGVARAGYSPVHSAISRLAELGTSTRPAMTFGFVVYGVGLLSYAAALRLSVPGAAWLFAAGAGVTIFGVAAFPLGRPDLRHRSRGLRLCWLCLPGCRPASSVAAAHG